MSEINIDKDLVIEGGGISRTDENSSNFLMAVFVVH